MSLLWTRWLGQSDVFRWGATDQGLLSSLLGRTIFPTFLLILQTLRIMAEFLLAT